MILIKQIEVEGYTAFDPEKIEALVRPYQGKELTFEQLKQLTGVITDLYTNQGYTTSGAFFPRQDISRGLIKIQVIEGSLENIEIEGLKRLKKSYISSRYLKNSSYSPLNVQKLQEDLAQLRLDPLIERVEARLVRGTRLGASVLLVEIEEAKLISASLEFNNQASPTTGEYRGIATLAHNNLLGRRDRAFAQLDLSDGFTAYELNYTLPLNYQGTAISIWYRYGNSLVVEEPLDEVDIRARADTLSFQLTQQLVRSVTTESSVSLIFDLSEIKTFIFNDELFPFAQGSDNGRSKLSVLRLQGDWRSRSNRDIISLRSRLSLGVDLFSATVNDDAPDGLFFSWLGQAQHAVVLDKKLNIVLITRLAAQLTPDSLLPFEQFTLGGSSTVRGYRRNYSLGDNGLVATVEVAFTVAKELKLSPFVDVGRVWNTDGDFSQSLASVGLRLEWQPIDSLFLTLDLAVPLSDVEERGNSLSDEGISFSLKFFPF